MLADVEADIHGAKVANGPVMIEALNLGPIDDREFDKRAVRKLRSVEKSGKKGKLKSGLLVLRAQPVSLTESMDPIAQQWLQMVYWYSMRKLRPENIIRTNSRANHGGSSTSATEGGASHTVSVGVPKYLIVVHVRRGDIVHDLDYGEERHEHMGYFETVLQQLLGDGSEEQRRKARAKAKARKEKAASSEAKQSTKTAIEDGIEIEEGLAEEEDPAGFPLLSCAVAEVIVVSQGDPAEFAPLLARYPPPCTRLILAAGGNEKTEQATDVFEALDVMAQVCVQIGYRQIRVCFADKSHPF
jgi:hypothetical protein